eukprot:scaffold5529_cov117-Cylindrotheca_fusiformis.AAC.13
MERIHLARVQSGHSARVMVSLGHVLDTSPQAQYCRLLLRYLAGRLPGSVPSNQSCGIPFLSFVSIRRVLYLTCTLTSYADKPMEHYQHRSVQSPSVHPIDRSSAAQTFWKIVDTTTILFEAKKQ